MRIYAAATPLKPHCVLVPPAVVDMNLLRAATFQLLGASHWMRFPPRLCTNALPQTPRRAHAHPLPAAAAWFCCSSSLSVLVPHFPRPRRFTCRALPAARCAPLVRTRITARSTCCLALPYHTCAKHARDTAALPALVAYTRTRQFARFSIGLFLRAASSCPTVWDNTHAACHARGFTHTLAQRIMP